MRILRDSFMTYSKIMDSTTQSKTYTEFLNLRM